MRAIDQDFDSSRLREIHNLLHGHYLPGEIRYVRKLDRLRPGRHRRDYLLGDVVQRRRRDLERHLLENDPFATLALVPRCDHSTVILIRYDYLFAALEIDTHDHDLDRLWRAAGSRHLCTTTSSIAP